MNHHSAERALSVGSGRCLLTSAVSVRIRINPSQAKPMAYEELYCVHVSPCTFQLADEALTLRVVRSLAVGIDALGALGSRNKFILA